jgi:hypothetical protein
MRGDNFGIFIYHNCVVNISRDEYLKTLYSSVYPEDNWQNFTSPPSKCFQVKKQYLKSFIDYIQEKYPESRIDVVSLLQSAL